MGKNKKTPMSNNYNFTYLFLPFRLNGGFEQFNNRLAHGSGRWERTDDIPNYMFRFVTNKIDGTDGVNRCCHYVLSGEKSGLTGRICTANRNNKLTIAQTNFGSYSLLIERVELFCFSTDVCLMAIKTVCLSNDTDMIINSRYNMKFASTPIFSFDDEADRAFSMLDFARMALSPDISFEETEFFYHIRSSSGSSRVDVNKTAFLLTYIYKDHNAAEEDDLFRECYFTRNAFSTFFTLPDEDREIKKECFSVSPDVIWGVTDRSAVCFGFHKEYSGFVENTLIKNISTSYLFMFAYLLHQKYVLYHFMMQIDTRLNNDLHTLEIYKEKLVDFKTYFLFARISEIPHYQGLYTKTSEVFGLKEMYEDVEEPLSMLDGIILRKEQQQRELEQEARARQDNTQNLLLAALGLLGVYSAFVDGRELADDVNQVISAIGSEDFFKTLLSHIPHCIVYLLILILIGYIAVRFIKNLGKPKDKDKDRTE